MQRQYKNFQGILISVGLLIFTCLLLLLQPDYGMTIVVAGVWFIQLFLAGVPLKKLVIPALGILVLLVVSYFA